MIDWMVGSTGLMGWLVFWLEGPSIRWVDWLVDLVVG